MRKESAEAMEMVEMGTATALLEATRLLDENGNIKTLTLYSDKEETLANFLAADRKDHFEQVLEAVRHLMSQEPKEISRVNLILHHLQFPLNDEQFLQLKGTGVFERGVLTITTQCAFLTNPSINAQFTEMAWKAGAHELALTHLKTRTFDFEKSKEDEEEIKRWLQYFYESFESSAGIRKFCELLDAPLAHGVQTGKISFNEGKASPENLNDLFYTTLIYHSTGQDFYCFKSNNVSQCIDLGMIEILAQTVKHSSYLRKTDFTKFLSYGNSTKESFVRLWAKEATTDFINIVADPVVVATALQRHPAVFLNRAIEEQWATQHPTISNILPWLTQLENGLDPIAWMKIKIYTEFSKKPLNKDEAILFFFQFCKKEVLIKSLISLLSNEEYINHFFRKNYYSPAFICTRLIELANNDVAVLSAIAQSPEREQETEIPCTMMAEVLGKTGSRQFSLMYAKYIAKGGVLISSNWHRFIDQTTYQRVVDQYNQNGFSVLAAICDGNFDVRGRLPEALLTQDNLQTMLQHNIPTLRAIILFMAPSSSDLESLLNKFNDIERSQLIACLPQEKPENVCEWLQQLLMKASISNLEKLRGIFPRPNNAAWKEIQKTLCQYLKLPEIKVINQFNLLEKIRRFFGEDFLQTLLTTNSITIQQQIYILLEEIRGTKTLEDAQNAPVITFLQWMSEETIRKIFLTGDSAEGFLNDLAILLWNTVGMYYVRVAFFQAVMARLPQSADRQKLVDEIAKYQPLLAQEIIRKNNIQGEQASSTHSPTFFQEASTQTSPSAPQQPETTELCIENRGPILNQNTK